MVLRHVDGLGPLGLFHIGGLANLHAEGVKILNFLGVELHQLAYVIERVVVEAVAHHTVHIHMLQLLEESVGTKLHHLAALHGDDRAEGEKLFHVLDVLLAGGGSRGILLLLLRERGKLGGLCHHLQRTVRGEVEDIALGLHPRLTVLILIGVRRLYTEDGLHVGGGGGVLRTLQIEHGSPWAHGDTRGQSATGNCDGVGLLGHGTDGFLHPVERILSHLVVLAVASHIDDGIEAAKHLVVAEQPFQSLRLLYARHHPKRMVERGAIFVGGEGVVALLVLGTHQVEKLPDGILMYKAATLLLGNVVALLGAEELLELEGGILAEVCLYEAAQVIGAYLHVGQFAVGVVLRWFLRMEGWPLSLGGLFLDVVPGVDLVVGKVLIKVERSAREMERTGVVVLCEQVDDPLSQFGACAFVRLIHHHEIPVGG